VRNLTEAVGGSGSSREFTLHGNGRESAENVDGERSTQSPEVFGSLRRKSTESQIANLQILEAEGHAAAH
jgi:hypothetical protein